MKNVYSQLREGFQKVDDTYRPVVFWSWNDRMEPEEIVRQVRELKEQGVGGFLMHSRDGLETSYLGGEWMKAIETAVAAAKEIGVKAWLYDEDRWPSGDAGGQVLAASGDEAKAKSLTLQLTNDGRSAVRDGRVLAVFRGRVTGERLEAWEHLNPDPWEDIPLRPGESLLVFRLETSGPSTIFQDAAPADLLSPAAVAAFIETTHEKYKQRIGSEFNRTVPGIFTDEPSVSSCQCSYTPTRGWVPWTEGFEDFFAERRGYDPLTVVPFLFFEGGGAEKARHDYWRTITERFSETYTKALYEWAEAHSLLFFGHMMDENELGLATKQNGAVMPHYRYMHIPGIDLLGDQTDEYMTVKQCTSAARQLGRSMAVSECFAGTGWEFDFETRKWIGDWQLVMGITMQVPHLSHYSLRGRRKRDYPPSLHYNNSWWNYNGLVEEYFARIAAVTSQGKACRDILVLHPAASAWTQLRISPVRHENWWIDRDPEVVNEYGKHFNSLLHALSASHLDYDLGDELILEELARVDEGKLTVGEAGYSLIVVPSLTNLFGNTVSLLESFLEAGGKVVVLGHEPQLADGSPSERLRQLWKHPGVNRVADTAELLQHLGAFHSRLVTLTDPYGGDSRELLCLLREIENGYTLFVVNNDRNRSREALISIAAAGALEEWDPLTGGIKEVAVEMAGGFIRFRADFAPVGSRLYVIRTDKSPKHGLGFQSATGLYVPPWNREKPYAALGPVFRFTRTGPNALVLDRCRYRVEKEDWSEETDILIVQDRIRSRYAFYNGGIQRYKWIGSPHPRDGIPVEILYVFQVIDVPQGHLFLVLETPEEIEVYLNGERVPSEPEGWYLDRSFRKLRIDGLLREGDNELLLQCAYTNRTELEASFIIGDFAVDPMRRIAKELERLRLGDWGLQGYLHYAGSLVYHHSLICQPEEGENYVLKLGAFHAVLVEVRVNGSRAGSIPWRAANGLELTPFLICGANSIDIEVVGSPRNLLGPLHKAATWDAWTDPSAFRTVDADYTPDYTTKPYGLLEPIYIEKRRI